MKDVQHVGSYSYKGMPKELAAYISGFSDGEGCFMVSFNKRAKMRTGIEVRPSFSISQNKRSLEAMKTIHAYFGCGAIRFSKSDQTYKYEVRSINDLTERIIPHFKKYPLLTDKSNDFVIFSEICHLVRRSHHLNTEVLESIIKQAYQMNKSGKRRFELADLLKSIRVR